MQDLKYNQDANASLNSYKGKYLKYKNKYLNEKKKLSNNLFQNQAGGAADAEELRVQNLEDQVIQLRNQLQANVNLNQENINFIVNNVLNEVNLRRLPDDTIVVLVQYIRDNVNIQFINFNDLVTLIQNFIRGIQGNEEELRNNLRLFFEDNSDLINDNIAIILNGVFAFINANGLYLNNIIELTNHLRGMNLRALNFIQIRDNIIEFLRNQIGEPENEVQRERNNLRLFLQNNTNLNNDDIDTILNNVFLYIHDRRLQPNIIPNLMNHLRGVNNLRNIQMDNALEIIMDQLENYFPIIMY
ncbi:hypothetical protein CPAV1605_81 [seawater metagenome]|uniref:Uncharacterized protein n=1 Tax=seawater metagenome TaxID=1561972 RepID=A0A5E8CI97_9ZZZZ